MQATLLLPLLVLSITPEAFAQTAAPPSPDARIGSTSVEALAGWAGFVGDPVANHTVLGGAVHRRLTGRVSIGTEAAWLRGPGADRDTSILGLVRWDLREPTRDEGRVLPYVVAGAGLAAQRSGYGRGTWSWEGIVSGGAGVRLAVARRVFLSPEVRFGWEPHVRMTMAAGWSF